MAIQQFTAGQTLTASSMNTLQASDFNYTRKIVTAATYTAVLTDRGLLLEFQNSGGTVVTIPANISVAFDFGDVLEMVNASTSSVQIVGDTGVSISTVNDVLTLDSPWQKVQLVKRETDNWILTGLGVANSSTTATSNNTALAIVSRDSSGDFSAGTITADLQGVATYTSEWVLGANGNNHYTFTGPGLTGAEDDPTLHLIRGQQYKFTNTMGMHPFRIQSTANGSVGTAYGDGIANNDVSNGTLTWNVQFDAPSVLYYQCTAHPSMGGKIYIVEETASMIGTRTVFVQQATPTANATGDIWFQVTGL